ncbi:zinc-dependent metalloprotease [Egicoccus sp. AB-alg2]|uniref:zinc-dependent metalloprotease n=1 Tax=Egicoccus sp. AB-alg2 TaxID=3242693 RepID=UPI00359D279A
MSDDPRLPGDDEPDDPFGGALPPELQAMFQQLGGSEGLAAMSAQLSQLFAGGLGQSGPVDWNLASRVALQVAADGDRGPTPEEETRARQAMELAEHWLDDSPLPASPDAGRLVVASRQTWVNAALAALRPLVEPVARASTDAMVSLAQEQLGELGEQGPAGLPGLEGLPPGLGDLLANLGGMDLGAMLRPAGAALMGLQAGQVVGQLSRQLLGQYDLGIPTAPRAEAYSLAVNVQAEFDGWDLDPMEVAVVLALTEAAHRRLFHAVPWLEAHVQSLVARFAAGTSIDAERMRELSEELMTGVDPDDPDSLREAMERAAGLRMEPTPDQRRVLERLQAVVCLVGAWARHEADRAAGDRLPARGRVEEVLRRRRATRGDGEELLAALLGLDLKPEDEGVGEAFVVAVEGALGPAGLHRALAHPENLPDAAELADPSAWLARTAGDHDVPDDLSELLGGEFGEAPVEGSADERLRQQSAGDADGADGAGADGEDADGEDEGGDGSGAAGT